MNNNYAHVFIIWPAKNDVRHEFPDEFGGIIHRFDMQVERDSELYTLMFHYNGTDEYTGNDITDADHMRMHFNAEEEWYGWLKDNNFALCSWCIANADTGEIYAETTTHFLSRWLNDEIAQLNEGNIDPSDFSDSIAAAVDMLRNINLG